MARKILFLHVRGTKVRAEGDTLVTFIPGQGVKRIPFKEIEELWIMEGVLITSDVIIRASKYGVSIIFARQRGVPSILIHGKFFPMPETRVEQAKAVTDERGITLARAFAYSSIHSRYLMLRYLARNRRKTNPQIADFLEEHAEKIKEWEEKINEVEGKLGEQRKKLNSLEGNAARIYYKALSEIIPERYWPTKGREYFPPPDPYNALISFGNSIVRGVVFRMVLAAGLDPTLGFLHKIRSGRRAMVYDLAEQFLVPISHLAVLKITTNLEMDKDDWVYLPEEKVYLTDTGRRKIFAEISKILERKISYQGEKKELRYVILGEARKIAKYLRGEIKEYKPFIPAW